MPSFSSVRRAGKVDCSTSRMISVLSDGEYLMLRLPHPRSCFFEQSVFEGEIGHDLLQCLCFAAEILHLVGGRGASCVAGESPLAGLQELFRPAIVHRRGDALAPTEFGDALLPAQPFQYVRIFSSAEKCRRVARRMSLIASSAGCFSGQDFCLIFAPCGYDDPEILPR